MRNVAATTQQKIQRKRFDRDQAVAKHHDVIEGNKGRGGGQSGLATLVRREGSRAAALLRTVLVCTYWSLAAAGVGLDKPGIFHQIEKNEEFQKLPREHRRGLMILSPHGYMLGDSPHFGHQPQFGRS